MPYDAPMPAFCLGFAEAENEDEDGEGRSEKAELGRKMRGRGGAEMWWAAWHGGWVSDAPYEADMSKTCEDRRGAA
ncbi:hypothetical protein V496_08699 [Pseudogymnoascus sp. VKM F-4515 (FW-2607)]|nr:hypothetical protein V496_08699 [Pseudogymnoascus sp. VKM F-4515 (FW-2607)]